MVLIQNGTKQINKHENRNKGLEYQGRGKKRREKIRAKRHKEGKGYMITQGQKNIGGKGEEQKNHERRKINQEK